MEGVMKMANRNKIKSNTMPLFQTLLLMAALILPYIIDIPSYFGEHLKVHNPEPEWQDFLSYYLLQGGNTLLAIGLSIWILIKIRGYNKDLLMNKNNAYHDYPFGWYWYCAKVLGINSCNLIGVPIHLQFKLIVRDVFKDYPLDERDFPSLESRDRCKVEQMNITAQLEEMNLILEDTYSLNVDQLPYKKRKLPLIKISRSGEKYIRYYSQEFVNTVATEIRQLTRIQRVNIFATTNPMNTKQIARAVFKMADRGNVDHIYVYQQKRTGFRLFRNKGYKIY